MEDTDCPFKALHLEREKDTLSSSFFTASKVQGVGSCLACDKPRCLYCDKQSSTKKMKLLFWLLKAICTHVDIPFSQTDTLYLN